MSAWGYNHNGELGLGLDDAEESEPATVTSKHLEEFQVIQVSGSAQHTLFLAKPE